MPVSYFKAHLNDDATVRRSGGGRAFGLHSGKHSRQRCGQFSYEDFNDGSGPHLSFLKQGVERDGVNERLREARDVRKINDLNQKSIIHAKSARSLRFSRRGHWAQLNGDMGRAHLPQPWAKGVLPLFPSIRIWAMVNTENPDVLMFDMPDSVEEQIELAKAYLRLVAHGWDSGFISGPQNCADLVKILVGVGFDKLNKNRKAWRTVRDALLEEGYIKRVPKSRGFYGSDALGDNFFLNIPRQSEHCMTSYSRDMVPSNRWDTQWELFKPYLRVPDEGLDFTQSLCMGFYGDGPVLPEGGFIRPPVPGFNCPNYGFLLSV